MKRIIPGFTLIILSLSLPTVLAYAANEAAQAPSEISQRKIPDDAIQNGENEVFDEDSPIKISDYYPSKVGSTWLFSNECGGKLSVKITGTEKICDITCIRLESVKYECPEDDKEKASSKTDPAPDKLYFVLDASGLAMTRHLLASGAHTDYCPRINMIPAEVELSDEVEYSHTDSPCVQPNGKSCGDYDGEGSFYFHKYEDITVPAGSFPHCLHIIRKYKFEEPLHETRGSIIEQTWNAKGIGPVKRYVKEEIISRRMGAEGYPVPATTEREETWLLEKYSMPK